MEIWDAFRGKERKATREAPMQRINKDQDTKSQKS